MARFVILSRPRRSTFPAALALLAALATSLSAQPMMETAATGSAPPPATKPATVPAPAKPAATLPAKTATTAPASAPATNAALIVPPDTYNRYGKIVAPGSEPAHPVRLNMPLPEVGEVKIPTQDELMMREKLEELARLSDTDIRTRLAQWPAFSKMTLRDEGTMLQRIQDFRDHHAKVAQMKEKQLGLSTLTPDQEARFEKEYWEKRLKMDQDLAKQFAPIMAAADQKLQEDLFREFSMPNSVPVPAPKSAPATTAPAKAAASATPPAAQKPVAAAQPAPAPDSSPTVGAKSPTLK